MKWEDQGGLAGQRTPRKRPWDRIEACVSERHHKATALVGHGHRILRALIALKGRRGAVRTGHAGRGRRVGQGGKG